MTAVSPASRRMFFYWLLLLVPTIVVGAAAIQLLRREQSRIAAQGSYAQDSRRAAAVARARLVVENVELLVGDVQAALLDTLATEPDESLEPFLANWEKNNPLVRTTFLAEPNGTLVRPTNDGTEDARGFIRRFSNRLQTNPPWAPQDVFREFKQEQVAQPATDEAVQRKKITSNVNQVQSARKDVQELAKARDYSSLSDRVAAETDARAKSDFALKEKKMSADVASRQRAEAESTTANRRAASLGSSASRSSGQLAAAPAAVMAEQKPQIAIQGRRGWIVETVEARPHLIGWVEPHPGERIRGVELELTALVSRLGGALPAEIEADEGYALLDGQQRVLHQVGAVGTGSSVAGRVPLSGDILPGWEVVSYLAFPKSSDAIGAGFFQASALVLALFVAAILAGGYLLLRQARRSELEAVQKTSFVANVSHEFKTPLTTIRLYSELLEQGRVRDPDQGNQYLRTIGRETERLTRLVNNALDFSRLEQGQKKFKLEKIELVTELSRLLETHAPRVAEAGLTLKRDLPDSAIHLTTDRDALEQIVLNLVDNAVKYASAGGEVLVSAAAGSRGGATICVADRGPGVPSDQRERIFDKFHRVDDALTAEKSGAGLGLSIARQLARGMGGDITYSPREGGGAEFVLTLS